MYFVGQKKKKKKSKISPQSETVMSALTIIQHAAYVIARMYIYIAFCCQANIR